MNTIQFKSSLTSEELANYVARQLNAFYPDNQLVAVGDVRCVMEHTLVRVKACFSRIHRKYYCDGTQATFNHLHSDHYAMFLYLLSNTAWKLAGNEMLAAKIFLLNKALHGLDVYYGIELPEVFLFIHPVGTVLGNARYGNYLTVYQNCGIGSLTESGDYPTLGEGVILFARSCLLGACHIGDDVVVGANAFLVTTDIPAHSVVVGQYPNHRILHNADLVRNRIFHS
ncbi:MAG TPA: serine acetyltransferase [Verrucomicrobia bacterium]|nr:MAG: hypothetical protein A2X46_08745 [Lentisphaerae bacterium GWF2_57_35]HBA82748.1 serine acetyltransferase [Verrucomicrobiota bacterium]